MHLTGRSILLAWMVSIAFHGAGLVGMFLLVFPYTPKQRAPTPVARAELIGDLESSSFFPTQDPDISSPQQPIEAPDVRFTPKKFEELSKLATSKKPELSIIGIGAGGADFSQYGLTAGPGAGPVFFGLGGSARGIRRIVYVVDRSGSMLDTFGYVRKELERSINELRRSQKFHVIFFNSGPPLESPPRKLVSAIQAQKTAFFAFLGDIFPEGSTNPEPAMRRALALKPDLIYFLTDGEFHAILLERLDKWNRDRNVQIFTIAYFDERGASLLERIAREHGGKFRFVSESDLP
jgi:hypothetical protein